MEVATAPQSIKSDDDEAIASVRTKNSYKHLLDSDSEEEIKDSTSVSKLLSEDSEEDEIAETSINKTINSTHSTSSDSEGEEEEQQHEAPSKVKDRRKNSNPKKKILPEKRQRKSAAKAMDVIKEKMSHKQQEELKQKIQSEKQRMEREQDIHVPYHKPRQYTLQEFLARKSLKKPTLEKGQKPRSAILELKKINENIEAFAQKMKEREEEAIAFFRSESESDGDEPCDNKENVSTNQAESKDTTTPEEVQLEENAPEEVVTLEESTDAKPSEDPELDHLRKKYQNIPNLDEVESKPDVPAPTLKTLQEMGSKDFVIDLGSGTIQHRNLSGPEKLFQRYLKTVQKPKQKEKVCMNILTVENGRIENQQIEVKLDKQFETDQSRPGQARGKLKEALWSKIETRRNEEMRVKAEQMKTVEFEPEDKPEADAAEEAEDEECEEDEDDEEIAEEDEEMENEDRKEKKKSKGSGATFLDNEAIDEDESEKESESDESSSSSEEEEEAVDAVPRKSRILKAFVDSDDEDNKPDQNARVEESEPIETSNDEEKKNPVAESDAANHLETLTKDNTSVTDHTEALETQDLEIPEEFLNVKVAETEDVIESDANDFDPFGLEKHDKVSESEDMCSTQPSDFTFTEPSVSEEMKTRGIASLFDSGPSQFADDDLMDICSGRFADTQAFATQISSGAQVNKTEDINSDSQFDSEVPEVVENIKSPEKLFRKLLDSSDEENDKVDGVVKEKRKRKKKRKQKLRKLGFSDDEDESVSNQMQETVEDEEDLEECEEEEEEVEEKEEILVDYDSEENEIEVKMTKKERVKAAGAYFENEAELSESEWGSADEDEKNLDKYDGELGDEDQFDQNQLREEVGRIHARKMLDDDIKKVKKIEELLFEDEENDGVGRERKFKWKNQDNKPFGLDDENARDADAALNADEGEEESEIAWRKMRYEREMALNEMRLTEGDSKCDEIVLYDQDSQTVTTSSTSAMAKNKFKIIRSSSCLEKLPNISDVAKKDSPFLIKATNMKRYQSSSFLSRDEQTLNRIARFVSHKDDEVTNFSHGSNSMSFATIDKPDDSKKRKSDGNKQQEPSKKRKVETQPKNQLFFDKCS